MTTPGKRVSEAHIHLTKKKRPVFIRHTKESNKDFISHTTSASQKGFRALEGSDKMRPRRTNATNSVWRDRLKRLPGNTRKNSWTLHLVPPSSPRKDVLDPRTSDTLDFVQLGPARRMDEPGRLNQRFRPQPFVGGMNGGSNPSLA